MTGTKIKINKFKKKHIIVQLIHSLLRSESKIGTIVKIISYNHTSVKKLLLSGRYTRMWCLCLTNVKHNKKIFILFKLNNNNNYV